MNRTEAKKIKYSPSPQPVKAEVIFTPFKIFFSKIEPGIGNSRF